MARRPGLDGVMLKIRRADECLAFLDDQRRSLLEATGNRVVGEFETGSGDCVFRVTGEPPLDWGIPIGEYAHALRSALDNLLWQLILARGGTPTKTTQWPIYEDEAKSIAKASGRTKIQAQTDGVLGEDLEFIEGHQPYKMGRSRAVASLRLARTFEQRRQTSGHPCRLCCCGHGPCGRSLCRTPVPPVPRRRRLHPAADHPSIRQNLVHHDQGKTATSVCDG